MNVGASPRLRYHFCSKWIIHEGSFLPLKKKKKRRGEELETTAFTILPVPDFPHF